MNNNRSAYLRQGDNYPSDELPDLAAGDHFAGMDEDGPPADINRESLPEFNGAWG